MCRINKCKLEVNYFTVYALFHGPLILLILAILKEIPYPFQYRNIQDLKKQFFFVNLSTVNNEITSNFIRPQIHNKLCTFFQQRKRQML